MRSSQSARAEGKLSIASSPAGTEGLIGAIDEVRVWTVARTEAEIAANYTVSLTGAESGLAAYYRLDEGSGTVAYDVSGALPITLYGSPVWITSGALLATAAR